MISYVNGLSSFKFPAGEIQVRLDVSFGNGVFHLRNSDDIMAMILAADAFSVMFPTVKMNATIPYVPYARQDRVCVPGEALSIRVMAKLVNGCNFGLVTTLDPHSDVAPALINNLRVIHQGIGVYEVLKSCAPQAIICPDAGARKKIYEVEQTCKGLGSDFPEIIFGNKKRDPKTGKLSGFDVEATEVPEMVLIVDDICDGGGTFVGLSEELRKKGAKHVGLYVSHGIFSKGVDALYNIDHIFTTDSYCQIQNNPKLTVLEVQSLTRYS